MTETPSVRNSAQHAEKARIKYFLNYESPALPLSYRPVVVGKLEQLETPSAIHPHARFCQHHNIEATAHKSPFPVPQTQSAFHRHGRRNASFAMCISNPALLVFALGIQ